MGFNIQIDNEVAERNRLHLDPDLLNVALSQFFHNALKYVRPNSDIIVSATFEDDKCELKITMQSTCIDEDEIDKIFAEKYKGRHSGNSAGDGIGMFIVRKALQVMGASIRVVPDATNTATIDDRKYSTNVFLIDFARKNPHRSE